MNEVSRTMFKKNGSKWEETYRTTDASIVYESFANDLLAKKIHKCRYIESIKDRTNYDGTRTIEVYYDNGTKSVYIVTDRI